MYIAEQNNNLSYFLCSAKTESKVLLGQLKRYNYGRLVPFDPLLLSCILGSSQLPNVPDTNSIIRMAIKYIG